MHASSCTTSAANECYQAARDEHHPRCSGWCPEYHIVSPTCAKAGRCRARDRVHLPCPRRE
eukprot:scaffold5418_cov132-Isochrysis_galbana.AAC.1